MEQLALNLGAIFLAAIGTLYLQRRLYMRRRRRHLHDEAREAAGLPIGRSRRDDSATYEARRWVRPGGVAADLAVLGTSGAPPRIAALLGAANFGTALTFGQLAFARRSVLGDSLRTLAFAQRARARRRSSRGRDLEVRARPRAIRTLPPAFSISNASSVAAAAAAGRQSIALAQRLGAEDLRRLGRPEVIAALGLRDRRAAALESPSGPRLAGPLDGVGERRCGDHAVGVGPLGELRRPARRSVGGRSAAGRRRGRRRARPAAASASATDSGAGLAAGDDLEPRRPSARVAAARPRPRDRAERRSRPPSPTRPPRNASSDQASIGLPGRARPAPSGRRLRASPRSRRPRSALLRGSVRPSPWRRSAPPAARRCTPRRPPRPCRGRT